MGAKAFIPATCSSEAFLGLKPKTNKQKPQKNPFLILPVICMLFTSIFKVMVGLFAATPKTSSFFIFSSVTIRVK